MNVVIFKDLTTDEYLDELDAEAKKYDGLYVEMDVPEQRKYVKDKSSLIEGLRKKIERARIDKSRDFKVLVEDEAKRIDERLVNANKPFMALIDEYKVKRAKILADKKAKEEAEDLRLQIITDHDEAISMDKLRAFEIQEKIREQEARDQKIADDAKEEAEQRARQAELDKLLAQKLAEQQQIEHDVRLKQAEDRAEQQRIANEERAKQDKIDSDNAIIAAQEKATKDAEDAQAAKEAQEKADLEAREKNKNHISKIRGEAKTDLIEILGIEEKDAISIVMAITKGLISNITINY